MSTAKQNQKNNNNKRNNISASTAAAAAPAPASQWPLGTVLPEGSHPPPIPQVAIKYRNEHCGGFCFHTGHHPLGRRVSIRSISISKQQREWEKGPRTYEPYSAFPSGSLYPIVALWGIRWPMGSRPKSAIQNTCMPNQSRYSPSNKAEH